jgi:hypothetical protein
MNHTAIKNLIRRGIGTRLDTTLFSNPVGTGYQGKIVSKTRDLLILENYYTTDYGLCVGSSDEIGWQSIEITPAMVGRTIARFLALEVKTPVGRPTPAQSNFIQQVRKAGGAAGIVRSVDDALEILGAI